MKRYLQVLLVFLLVVISFHFFEAWFLKDKLAKYIVFFSLSGAIAISVPYLMPKQDGFVLPVQLIVLSILLSMFMAYLSWDQGLMDSIIETVPYLIWIVFFYLLHIKIPVKTIEKIILIYGAVYVILYFYQLANSHTVLFGKPISGDEFTEQRGAVRIIFPGAGIFILAIFMAINKLTTGAKGKWIWITFSILGIVIPILQVTRQFIAGVLLIYLFHLIRNQSVFKKALIMTSFIGILIFMAYSDNQMIIGVIEAQERDAKLGEDYIRVLAGGYFITDFSPNPLSRILGNGAPNWGVSDYGVFIKNLADRREYFLSDVGIIGMYAMFGILAVIGYIQIWVKSITIPLPKEYYYLKYYLWYLLITSLTWYSVYHYSYLISTVFVLYSYQVIYKYQERVKVLKRRFKYSAVSVLKPAKEISAKNGAYY